MDTADNPKWFHILLGFVASNLSYPIWAVVRRGMQQGHESFKLRVLKSQGIDDVRDHFVSALSSEVDLRTVAENTDPSKIEPVIENIARSPSGEQGCKG